MHHVQSYKLNNILLFCFLLLLSACSTTPKTEANLSKEDLAFLEEIVQLDKDEKIELFETNGGFRNLYKGGSIMTNKRLTAYWFDDRSEDIVRSIEYINIDSMKPIDRRNAITEASYLQVYGLNMSLKIFIDADSARTWTFFNRAMDHWNATRSRN